jgi:hypothetical protein
MACDNCQIKDYVIRTNEQDIKKLRAELLDAQATARELAEWIKSAIGHENYYDDFKIAKVVGLALAYPVKKEGE